MLNGSTNDNISGAFSNFYDLFLNSMNSTNISEPDISISKFNISNESEPSST